MEFPSPVAEEEEEEEEHRTLLELALRLPLSLLLGHPPGSRMLLLTCPLQRPRRKRTIAIFGTIYYNNNQRY